MGATVVQSAKGFMNVPFGNVTATFPSPVTAGNAILLVYIGGGGVPSGAPSDSVNGSIYSSISAAGSAWATTLGAWYAKGVAAGSTTVASPSVSGLNNEMIHAFEIAGADGTNPILTFARTENHPSVSYAPSVGITLSQAALVIGCGGTASGSGSGGTASAGGGATQLTAIQQSDQSNCATIGESQACGSGSNTISISGSGIGSVSDWAMIAVAFKDASASGPPAALLRRRRWTNPVIPVIN